MATKVVDSDVYVLKITLRGSSPPIWRRVRIADDTTLMGLHEVIQVVMGWEGYHMFQFEKNRTYYGDVSMNDVDYGPEMEDANEVGISELLPSVKSKLKYIYDFGDSWEHEILLEKKEKRDAGRPLPECIAGKCAAPPEDCGGIYGYYNLLEILADPEHEEHEERLEWTGGPIDPSRFDLERANQELTSVFRPKK